MIEADFLRTTRAAYDARAADYAEWIRHELDTKPLDRAVLAAFAELVRTAGGGAVADIGCGTGRITDHLRSLGLAPFGIDLSPQMIAMAQRDYPDLTFEVASMTALEIPDQDLAGLVAWYSTIHIPDQELKHVFAEFYRMLAPGGHGLLAFQVGDEMQERPNVAGTGMTVISYRRRPEHVAELLDQAGLITQAQLVRQPDADDVETTPQAYLLVHKPTVRFTDQA